MTEIVAVYKASEHPCIFDADTRRRMAKAAKEWDDECEAYYVSIPGCPVEMVVGCHPSLLDQRDKLIRRVEAAMKSPTGQ